MSGNNMFSTPKSKRLRSDESPISHTNNSPKIIQLINRKYAEQNQIMLSQIEECVKKSVNDALSALEEKVNKNTEILKTLSERVHEIEHSLPSINEMKIEISKLKATIVRQENVNVSTNLRLCGIPFNQNENLPELFWNLCDSLKIDRPNIKSIHRINNTHKNNSVDGVVLVKLFSSQERNNILRVVSKYKRENKSQLTLNTLLMGSHTPFFLNEDLTNYNYKILQGALKLKRQKMISTAFTLRGFVYVKRLATDPAERIECIEELDKFFRQSYSQNSAATFTQQ